MYRPKHKKPFFDEERKLAVMKAAVMYAVFMAEFVLIAWMAFR